MSKKPVKIVHPGTLPIGATVTERREVSAFRNDARDQSDRANAGADAHHARNMAAHERARQAKPKPYSTTAETAPYRKRG